MKFHLLAGASLASLAAVTAALPAHAYEGSALAASVAVAGEVVRARGPRAGPTIGAAYNSRFPGRTPAWPLPPASTRAA